MEFTTPYPRRGTETKAPISGPHATKRPSRLSRPFTRLCEAMKSAAPIDMTGRSGYLVNYAFLAFLVAGGFWFGGKLSEIAYDIRDIRKDINGLTKIVETQGVDIDKLQRDALDSAARGK
jgi:hypothetical protein